MEMTKDAKLMSFTRVFPGLRENLKNCPCLGFIFYLVSVLLCFSYFKTNLFFLFLFLKKKKGKKREIDKEN